MNKNKLKAILTGFNLLDKFCLTLNHPVNELG